MKISEAARLTGVTVRTLHYYDKIGLLKPSAVTDAGYRVYSADDLARLQQILFFRELDFPLEDIRAILQDPAYDRQSALRKQRELLLQKRRRLDGLISLVDKTLQGEQDMSFKQFDMTEIEATRKQYAAEAKQRWGSTAAYAEYEQKTARRTPAEQQMLDAEGTAILQAIGESRTLAPDSAAAQALVKRWQDYITKTYYRCTNEILAGLGQMYTTDERFTQNLDRFGAGTAAFLSTAIAVYTH